MLGENFPAFTSVNCTTEFVAIAVPIFAHTPEDSTLAAAVRKYRIGSVCPASDRQGIQVGLEALAQLEEIPRERFEQARSELLGVTQVKNLEGMLRSSGMPFVDRPASLVS